MVHLNWIVYISTIKWYEPKCRTLNATVLYGANHDIHSVTTLIFGCGPEGAASCDFVDRYTWLRQGRVAFLCDQPMDDIGARGVPDPNTCAALQ